MSEPRTLPEWFATDVIDGAPLVVRSVGAVAIVMSIADYNALVFVLGVAAASGHDFIEIALRLMRAFNPAPPEAAREAKIKPEANDGRERIQP
jgi:hypothetical protein